MFRVPAGDGNTYLPASQPNGDGGVKHQSQRHRADQRIFLSVFCRDPDFFRVRPDCFDGAAADLARFGEQRAAALFVPPVFTSGVCNRQDERVADSDLGDHVDTGRVVISLPVISGGGGMGRKQPLDRRRGLCRKLDMDPVTRDVVGDNIGLGEVAIGCERCLVWTVHNLECNRVYGKRGASNKVGRAFQPDLYNEDDRGQLVPRTELGGASELDGASDFGGVDHVSPVPRVLFVSSHPQGPGIRGGAVTDKPDDHMIVFEDVSKFYGEILGVNRVSLAIEPGITSLVGPNGSGKTTLMNLMTGLIRPTRGRVSVLGLRPDHPEVFFSKVGYCSQFDSFTSALTGFQFIYSYLRVHGRPKKEAQELAWKALHRVDLLEAAHRKIAAYSKGMRQRVRFAQAIAHEPAVMILDEPLNGLDPMARAETIRLFRQLAGEGLHLIISSHILHEVDMMSDSVILLNNGYVVAEGEIHGVRSEMEEHPMQILIRCDRPGLLAARVFEQDSVVEAKIHKDKHGLFIKTRDADAFYLLLNTIVVQDGLNVESVAPADDDLNAVYQYLIGGGEGA